jgi:hypothetical protein
MWYHGVSLWWYHELVVFCWWYQARDTTSFNNGVIPHDTPPVIPQAVVSPISGWYHHGGITSWWYYAGGIKLVILKVPLANGVIPLANGVIPLAKFRFCFAPQGTFSPFQRKDRQNKATRCMAHFLLHIKKKAGGEGLGLGEAGRGTVCFASPSSCSTPPPWCLRLWLSAGAGGGVSPPRAPPPAPSAAAPRFLPPASQHLLLLHHQMPLQLLVVPLVLVVLVVLVLVLVLVLVVVVPVRAPSTAGSCAASLSSPPPIPRTPRRNIALFDR